MLFDIFCLGDPQQFLDQLIPLLTELPAGGDATAKHRGVFAGASLYLARCSDWLNAQRLLHWGHPQPSEVDCYGTSETMSIWLPSHWTGYWEVSCIQYDEKKIERILGGIRKVVSGPRTVRSV